MALSDIIALANIHLKRVGVVGRDAAVLERDGRAVALVRARRRVGQVAPLQARSELAVADRVADLLPVLAVATRARVAALVAAVLQNGIWRQ